MRTAYLAAPLAVILLGNTFALIHVVRNRTGTPESEVTLTQRELQYFNSSVDNDDSGVTLTLQWTDPEDIPWTADVERRASWLDQKKLQSLGFSVSMDLASASAQRYYQRQPARQLFVALEYDGAAWRSWAAAYELAMREVVQSSNSESQNLVDATAKRSHLVAIDADRNAVTLRDRHPDRTSVVIVPAVIGITAEPFLTSGKELDPKHPFRLVGRIQQLPAQIHVPRPLSDGFRRLNRRRPGVRRPELSYRVHLRYGKSLEPWIVSVDFDNSRSQAPQ